MKVWELMAELAKLPAGREINAVDQNGDESFVVERVDMSGDTTESTVDLYVTKID